MKLNHIPLTSLHPLTQRSDQISKDFGSITLARKMNTTIHTSAQYQTIFEDPTLKATVILLFILLIFSSHVRIYIDIALALRAKFKLNMYIVRRKYL